MSSCPRSVQLVQLFVLGKLIISRNLSCMYLASLYDGALMLLTAVRIGMSFVCIFSLALSIGDVGLSCVKYFAFCLSMSMLWF